MRLILNLMFAYCALRYARIESFVVNGADTKCGVVECGTGIYPEVFLMRVKFISDTRAFFEVQPWEILSCMSNSLILLWQGKKSIPVDSQIP